MAEHNDTSKVSEASWQQLLESDALEDLLQNNPDLCRQLELAIAAQEASGNGASEATIDLGPMKTIGAMPLGQFGDYELLEEIGRGGMGVVFRAWQRSLARTVALKMILAGEFANEQELKRFYAEAAAAAKLSHHGIVPIHEVNHCEGRHYFSMDLIEGPTLDHVLKMQPLKPDQAADIVRKIAKAAAYAHERGVIHRDLKPANILLDVNGEPRIADFGLAKWGEGDGTNEHTGDIVGTPSYMSPEQAAGRVNEITASADIYSLGAILYACLTGRPPFQSESKLDTILAVLESEATLPRAINRQVPRELEWIVVRCLEKRPDNRYPSAQALADDLERYLLGEPIEARRTGWWPKVRRWWRRQPTLVSHLAVIALVMSVHQGLHLWIGGSTDYLVSMTMLFSAWVIACIGYQALLEHPRRATLGRFAWAATDAAMLTMALYLTGPPLGGLLIGYPLLVVASSLFFRVRLVMFMLIACLLGYSVLASSYEEMHDPIYPPIYFVLGLTALGLMVGYQVYRIRVLSNRYRVVPTG